MKTSQVMFVLLVAILANLLLTTLLHSNKGNSAPTQALVASPNQALRASSDDAHLLAQYSNRIEELEMRLAVLEQHPSVQSTADRVAIPSAETVEAEAEIKTFLAALKSSGDELPDQLKTSVQVALEKLEEDRRLEREEERRIEREERLDKRVSEMRDELGLDATQEQGVRDIFAAESQRWIELKAGDDRGKMNRDEARQVKDDTRDAVQALLTPQQLETWQSSRGDGRDSKRDRGSADTGGGDRQNDRRGGNRGRD
ncbi:MAG: hypothetical protein ACI835_003984 [Planctomycetota bacterium]|jgi:hypothetical protein